MLQRSLSSLFWKWSRRSVRLADRSFHLRILLPNPIRRFVNQQNWLTDVYKAVLTNARGHFLDVGANVGQSLYKVLSIDPDRSYIGFEPQLVACAFLHQFIVENTLSNCRVFPIALTDKQGFVRLMIRDKGYKHFVSDSASIISGFRPDNFYSGFQWIQTVEGDEFLSRLDLKEISMIKIDVEGAELEVVQGLKKTIQQHRPILLFEVLHHFLIITDQPLSPDMIEFREKRLRLLEQTIRHQDYDIFHIIGSETLEKVTRIKPETKPDQCKIDYVAVPHEKESVFLAAMKFSRKLINSTSGE